MNKSAMQTTQSVAKSLTPTHGGLQRRCDCGNHTVAGGECESCSANKRSQPRSSLTVDSTVAGTRGRMPQVGEITRRSVYVSNRSNRARGQQPLHHEFSRIPVTIQARLAMSPTHDVYEQEADRAANQVMKDISAIHSHRPFGGTESCLARKGAGGLDPRDDDINPVGGNQSRARNAVTRLTNTANRHLHFLTTSAHTTVLKALRGGNTLRPDVRAPFESSFRHDFSQVHVHSDTAAGEAASLLGARAFTVGRDIVFGRGQYSPDSQQGRWLLGHELAHVVQQSGSAQGHAENASTAPIQRDLAIEPPHPNAVARTLTADQIREAIRFNQFRFKDPWDIRNVRDVMGIDPIPAVIDEDFVLAVLQWQAEHGLPENGRVGAETTRTFLRELRAEREPRKASDLARDNFVTTNTLAGPIFNNCGALPRFRWDVSLNTSLRNGFIIQRIDNAWNPQPCGAAPLPAMAVPTPRYWEAWQVNNLGVVTPAVGALNDRWQRAFPAGSRGTWRMTGTFFTVLTLPAAAAFAAGNVADAGILLSTAVAPNADRLGLVAGRRTIGGRWDCCAPTNTHTQA
jgi:hypothetical protein